MGTNYYIELQEPCPTCGREYDQLHIGKSSGGWCFSLHVIPPEEAEHMKGLPEEGLLSLDDWVAFWQGKQIVNEYDDMVTEDEMLLIITVRPWKRENTPSKSYLLHNHARIGPKGLLRRRIDGNHCIGHGEGMWDLVTGDFS